MKYPTIILCAWSMFFDIGACDEGLGERGTIESGLIVQDLCATDWSQMDLTGAFSTARIFPAEKSGHLSLATKTGVYTRKFAGTIEIQSLSEDEVASSLFEYKFAESGDGDDIEFPSIFSYVDPFTSRCEIVFKVGDIQNKGRDIFDGKVRYIPDGWGVHLRSVIELAKSEEFETAKKGEADNDSRERLINHMRSENPLVLLSAFRSYCTVASDDEVFQKFCELTRDLWTNSALCFLYLEHSSRQERWSPFDKKGIEDSISLEQLVAHAEKCNVQKLKGILLGAWTAGSSKIYFTLDLGFAEGASGNNGKWLDEPFWTRLRGRKSEPKR